MVDYVPYQVAKNAAAGQGMVKTPGTVSYAPNLLGKATQSETPQFTRPTQKKYGVHLLQYPTDVADNPQMGHHIMFQISTVDKGKLKEVAETRKAKLNKVLNKIEAEMAATKKEFSIKSDAFDSRLRKLAIEKLKIDKTALAKLKAGSSSTDTTSIMAQSPRKHLKTTIALYMPPTVSVKYGSSWGQQTIGVMAQIGHDAIKAFSGGAEKGAVMGMLDKAGTGLKHLALSALDTVAPGARTLAAIETGKIVTERMELMFEGIQRRDFSYEFTFIPQSEAEAKIIDEIVYTFKYHMASNLVKGSGGKEYTIPDMFDIQYMYHGGENSFLNKISTCALESMEVSFGGDKYQTYPVAETAFRGSGTPPVSTKISLSFKELELITKDKVLAGY